MGELEETYCLMTAIADHNDESRLDQVGVVLGLFEGDASATIGALLAELQFVRGQLALCEAGMSVGVTRGWVPIVNSEGDGNV